MNPKRLPIGVLVIIPVLIGMGVYAFTGQEPVEPAPGSETATATATETAEPLAAATLSPDELARQTEQAYLATATYEASLYPTPLPEILEHGVFHNGALVRVATGDGDCLNARWSPSVSVETSGVNVCLPEGYTGMLSGAAYESDGRWWWYMAGAGYVAEEFLAYAGDADLRQAMAPQYANAGGLIAFGRDDGAIWVMRPDGSEQRQLVDADQARGLQHLAEDFNWSPDGTLLSYNSRAGPRMARQPPRSFTSSICRDADVAVLRERCRAILVAGWLAHRCCLDGRSGRRERRLAEHAGLRRSVDRCSATPHARLDAQQHVYPGSAVLQLRWHAAPGWVRLVCRRQYVGKRLRRDAI